jgi:hypothetical protein
LQNEAKSGIIKADRILSPSNIEAINDLLRKDQRVELIPTKNGVIVYRVRREEVKQ